MPPRRSSRRATDGGARGASSGTCAAISDSITVGVGTRKAQRKSPSSNKRVKRANGKATKNPARRPLQPGGKLQLSEVGERLVLSFLPLLPDRIHAERVCKRWRWLSKHDLPIWDLDFSAISMRKVTKNHLKTLLSRASGKLTRVSLPGFSLDDASMVLLTQNTELKHVRAYTLCRKQIFSLLAACTMLESLELLDCQLLIFTRWDPQPHHLRTIRFLACHAIRTPAIASMITKCGKSLQQLELTGAEYVDSSIFRVLARHAQRLQDLTISYSRAIRFQDIQALVETRCDTLRLLDLTSCTGFNSFPNTTKLLALEVVILDNTDIRDDSLKALAQVASQLKYLSLQDCRSLTDEGLIDLAACTTLELIDLKGTPVTDAAVDALETGCPSLQMLRLDSCRGVSRSLRLRHGEQTRNFLQRRMSTFYERMAVARIATPEQIAAAATVLTSESESENASDTSYRGR